LIFLNTTFLLRGFSLHSCDEHNVIHNNSTSTTALQQTPMPPTQSFEKSVELSVVNSTKSSSFSFHSFGSQYSLSYHPASLTLIPLSHFSSTTPQSSQSHVCCSAIVSQVISGFTKGLYVFSCIALYLNEYVHLYSRDRSRWQTAQKCCSISFNFSHSPHYLA
jgi:hypothetical protein